MGVEERTGTFRYPRNLKICKFVAILHFIGSEPKGRRSPIASTQAASAMKCKTLSGFLCLLFVATQKLSLTPKHEINYIYNVITL